MEPGFDPATPILRVSDLTASLDHYARVLGFDLKWRAGTFASVGRGRCSLFLCEGDQGHAGGWVWIGVGDAAALHEELLAKGARVRHPPTNYAWALEMQVEDPDGNVLRFGSDPREGVPPGEWLDGAGVRWEPVEGGGFRRVPAG